MCRSASAAGAFVRDTLGARAAAGEALAHIEHGFTHFDLRITPLLVRCARPRAVMEAPAGLWYNLREPSRVGLPAPITALLAGLARESLFDTPGAH